MEDRDVIKSMICYLIIQKNIGVEYLKRKGKYSKEKLMQLIKNEVEGCKKCELHKHRKNVVVGEGNLDAELMFIGEGPGRYEDLQGRPFVGASGNLLTKIIEAMNLKREQVYIANIVKCRPPGNRDPKEEEIEQCLPYLIRQIEIIKPKLIVTLGRIAIQTLLDTKKPLSYLRGRFHKFRDIDIIATYHPSFLLQNPKYKKHTWEDMKKVMEKLKLTTDAKN